MEKDWPKKPFHHQLQVAWEKTLMGRNSCTGGSPCPCTVDTAGALQTNQLHHLPAQPSLGQRCHGQRKSLASVHAGLLWSSPTL